MAHQRIFIGLLLSCCGLINAQAQESDDELDFLDFDAPSASEDKSSNTPPPASTEVIPLAPESLPEAKPAARRGRVIEEIVVTAQKTEQTLQEVPVAVSVVSGDTLRDSGVFGAEGIENLVPNLELDTDAQSPTIGIRGFSTDSYNVGLEPSVGIIIDDVPIGRTEFIPDGLYDLSRVEVLRGPQGTLFGKNTIAGVLIFGTGEPVPEPGGSMLLTVGGKDDQRLEASYNQPLSDNLLARVAALGWKSSGEVDNSFLDRREVAFDQFAARLKFTYDPTDRLQLRFGGQIADIDTNYANWQLFDVDEDAMDYARTKDPDTEDNPFDAHTSFDVPGFVKHSTDLVHLAADYELSDRHSVVAIAGHASMDNLILMDFDVSAANLANVNVHHTYSQESLELRFTGNFDFIGHDLEYVGGLFSFQSDMFISVDVALGTDIVDFAKTPAGAEALGAPDGNPLGPILNAGSLPGTDLGDGIFQVFNQEAQSFAGFGQVTWSLTDHFSVIAGLRAGNEKKDAVLSIESRGPGLTAFVVGANDPPDTDFVQPLSRRETEISPKLGMRYAWHDDLSSYFSWTRGYKGGGFNAISFNDQDLVFEPEQGDNYELGMKSRWLDNSLAINATIYHTEVSNMQVVNFNGVSFDVFNAAESVLEGLEMDFTWLTPWEWLSINGALAIARAEYDSYPTGPQTAEQSDNCGPESDPNGPDCVQDLSGKTLPKAPEMTASLSPVIQLPLGKALGIVIGTDISFRGDQYLTLDLDPHSFQKAQTLIAARVSIGPPDESWGLTLRGDNLSNQKALSFVADHNLFANSYFATQTPERSVSLTFSANW